MTLPVGHRRPWLLLATLVTLITLAVTTTACQGGTSTKARKPTADGGTVGTPPQAEKVTCPAGSPTVHNAGDLRSALATASPGAVIRMADGTYDGGFAVAKSGTEAQPIWLCGSRNAVLDGGDKTDYVMYIDHASYIRLVGFTVRNGKKGVMADGTQHSIISGLSVNTIGDEAIHLRSFSSDNLVTGNTVRNTGNRSKKFGEGIYVGSANSNWCKYSSCKPDNSDRNSIIGNDVADTTSENIDIKEGTTGGIISGNLLSSAGMVEADSWIDLKGNGWTVENNTGRGGGGIVDGIQTHVVSKGWGRRNTIRNNTLVVDGSGFGVYIHQNDTENMVGCDNKVQGAAKGFSNVKCV